MTAPRIVAIDPGTHCGFAVRDRNGRMDAGTWDLAPRRDEGPGMRVFRFATRLTDLLDLAKPDLVVVEKVRRHAGTQAAHVYGALVGRLQEICETRGVLHTSVEVAHVKKLATGKGNAKKDAMVAAANVRWGLTLEAKDENEADARWIAEAAALEHGGDGCAPLPREQWQSGGSR